MLSYPQKVTPKTCQFGEITFLGLHVFSSEVPLTNPSFFKERAPLCRRWHRLFWGLRREKSCLAGEEVGQVLGGGFRMRRVFACEIAALSIEDAT